jgi:serine/threonine protein kinase/WD40 repeat protein
LKTDEDIFEAALDLPEPERPAFLARTLGSDTERRTRIATLLQAHESAGSFLGAPVVARSVLPPAEKPGDVIDRYTLLERLGEGGGGVVWRAQQERPLRREVAFKIIKLGMDTHAVVSRFEAERQALARMEHPHIARVFDAGITATGRPYFVMELVRGQPVTRYCDDRRLPVRRRLELFIEVCDAVQHAHQKGIIHRDLKPSNILVTDTDGAAVPKVIDFGIAKATQGRLTDDTLVTASAPVIGTPAYMSPEQADLSGLDVDTRSDIYSLGILLFELLSGRPPFDTKAWLAGGLDEIRRRLREDEAPPPSQRLETISAAEGAAVAERRGTAPALLRAQLRGDLDWIVLRCLEKDRTRRYESASALALDLRRHLEHEPVTARPRSRWYVTGKLIRRHRAAFAAVSTIAAAIVIGGGVSAWQAVRATRAEREQSRLRALEIDLRQRAERQERAAELRAYAADMNLAQQALANDNLGLAQRLLNRHRPTAGLPDLRGWDWRYLWQQARSEATRVVTTHPHPVESLAVSPDGTWLAIGQDDGGILHLTNLRTREQIPLPAGEESVHAAFSPAGTWLALSVTVARGPNAQHAVRWWNLNTREFGQEWPLSFAPGPLSFSPDGQSLIVSGGSRTNPLTQWDVPTGRRRVEQKATGWSIAVSPDHRFVAREVSRTGRTSLQVTEVATGAERWRDESSDDPISALTFSPDGAIIAAATGNDNPEIRLFAADTGRLLARLKGHRTYVAELLFWPDGRTLASAGTDQTVRLWDYPSGELRRTLRGHTLEVHSLALLPDGTTLVSGAKDGAVLLWETDAAPAPGPVRIDAVGPWHFTADGSIVSLAPTGEITLRSGPAYDRVTAGANVGRRLAGPQRGGFAHQASLVAVVRDQGDVAIVDWRDGRDIQRLVTGAPGVTVVGFAADDRSLILLHDGPAPENHRLHAWDVATGRRTHSWSPQRPNARAIVHPTEGRWVSLHWEDGPLTLVDLETKQERLIESSIPLSPSLSVSPDGRWFATAHRAGWARIWELATARPVADLSGFILGVHSAHFSPDGRRLITGSGGREAIRMWDTESHEALLTLPAIGTIFGSTRFSPDGHTIASRNSAGQLHVWRAPSWEQIAEAERAHPGAAAQEISTQPNRPAAISGSNAAPVVR